MKSVMEKAGIVLPLLHGLGKSFGKDYCYPSQKKILQLIKIRYSCERCRRTLNYWLAAFTEDGLLKRVQRHRNDGTLGMIFQSTMYFISLKGYKFLRTLGINVFRDLKAIKSKMAERFKSKYIKGKENIKYSGEDPESRQLNKRKKPPAWT